MVKSPFVFPKKTESDKVSVFSKGDIIVSLRSDFKALKKFLTLWESEHVQEQLYYQCSQ